VSANPIDKPTHVCLGRISRRISTDGYHRLFQHLGLKPNDVKTAEQSFGQHTILRLLLKWTSTRRNATYQTLNTALEEEEMDKIDMTQVSCSF